MAQQTINIGSAPNDGTGTPLRTAFSYVNSNFTELYAKASIFTGIVDPEGIVTAVPGSIYFNIAIAASPVQFIKGSGSGNTGWV
jgi:hypothetical protein